MFRSRTVASASSTRSLNLSLNSAGAARALAMVSSLFFRSISRCVKSPELSALHAASSTVDAIFNSFRASCRCLRR